MENLEILIEDKLADMESDFAKLKKSLNEVKNNNLFDSLVTMLNDELQASEDEAYDSGYDEGCEDGYADGYQARQDEEGEDEEATEDEDEEATESKQDN